MYAASRIIYSTFQVTIYATSASVSGSLLLIIELFHLPATVHPTGLYIATGHVAVLISVKLSVPVISQPPRSLQIIACLCFKKPGKELIRDPRCLPPPKLPKLSE